MTLPAINTLNTRLRQHGLRHTPQRALVLRLLQEAEKHLDAESLWERARQQDASVNLATVYRTLNTLVQVGLAQRSFLGGQNRSFYEAVLKPEHFHFACLRCGKVIELDCPRLAEMQRDLSQSYGLLVQRAHVKFEGLCPDCKGSS